MSANPVGSSHWLLWSLTLIVLFGFAALIAGSVGNALGCSVNEGGVSSCIFMGRDIGEILADFFVAGWLMFVTLPAAGVAFLVWLVVAIITMVRRRRLGASGI